MKLSTLSALVPLIPALQAFVIVNPQDQHAQKVFLSRTEQQEVISDAKDTVISDASYKDPFWHPASLIKTDVVDNDKYPSSYLSSLAGAIGKNDGPRGQDIWRKAAGKLRGLKDDVVEALYDEVGYLHMTTEKCRTMFLTRCVHFRTMNHTMILTTHHTKTIHPTMAHLITVHLLMMDHITRQTIIIMIMTLLITPSTRTLLVQTTQRSPPSTSTNSQRLLNCSTQLPQRAI